MGMEIIAHKYEWKEISLPVVFVVQDMPSVGNLERVLWHNIRYCNDRTEHHLHRKYDVHPLMLPPYVKRKYVRRKS